MTWRDAQRRVAEARLRRSDPARLDPSELTFLANDRRAPYVAAFSGADANKTAHYMLRGVAAIGQEGPWSETASATIGACDTWQVISIEWPGDPPCVQASMAHRRASMAAPRLAMALSHSENALIRGAKG